MIRTELTKYRTILTKKGDLKVKEEKISKKKAIYEQNWESCYILVGKLSKSNWDH